MTALDEYITVASAVKGSTVATMKELLIVQVADNAIAEAVVELQKVLSAIKVLEERGKMKTAKNRPAVLIQREADGTRSQRFTLYSTLEAAEAALENERMAGCTALLIPEVNDLIEGVS